MNAEFWMKWCLGTAFGIYVAYVFSLWFKVTPLIDFAK